MQVCWGGQDTVWTGHITERTGRFSEDVPNIQINVGFSPIRFGHISNIK